MRPFCEVCLQATHQEQELLSVDAVVHFGYWKHGDMLRKHEQPIFFRQCQFRVRSLQYRLCLLFEGKDGVATEEIRGFVGAVNGMRGRLGIVRIRQQPLLLRQLVLQLDQGAFLSQSCQFLLGLPDPEINIVYLGCEDFHCARIAK